MSDIAVIVSCVFYGFSYTNFWCLCFTWGLLEEKHGSI